MRKKYILHVLLTASLIFSNTSISSAVDLDKDFESITRVYGRQNEAAVNYHYVDENNKTVDLTEDSDKNKTAEESAGRLLKKTAALPASYDLRTLHAVTPVKNQGVTGCCWSFAAIKSLESNLLLKKRVSPDSIDLSENHLAWFSYHPSKKTSDVLYSEGLTSSTSCYLHGGNALFAEYTLARGSGAVQESAAPFNALNNLSLADMTAHMTKNAEASRYRSDYFLNDVAMYDREDKTQIKQALMENGAIDVAFYYEKSYDNCISSTGPAAYYQNIYQGEEATAQANHCVTIIGWDDNYPKENFKLCTPTSDGAWLIANSYGAEYGENGYFWLSYEEPSLTEFYSFSADTDISYDNTYQYDAFGWGNLITNKILSSTTAANIFTASKSYSQSLDRIGIYTATANQPYTVKIYRNVAVDKPTSGTLAATIRGTAEFSGYHTLSLDSPVTIAPGERFSVVITYDKTTLTTGYIPIEGGNYISQSFDITYTSSPRQSYVSLSPGKWADLNQGSGNIKNNVCVKAFTNNKTKAGVLKLSLSKVTLGRGETIRAKANQKKVTWKSSKPSVASVGSNGKIKAKKKGTATITAYSDSAPSKSIKVTVKKAPSKLTLLGKTKVKKGSSFTIKKKVSSGACSHVITFSSSNKKVATVTASGKVRAQKKGSTTIIGKTYNGKKGKLKITVY